MQHESLKSRSLPPLPWWPQTSSEVTKLRFLPLALSCGSKLELTLYQSWVKTQINPCSTRLCLDSSQRMQPESLKFRSLPPLPRWPQASSEAGWWTPNWVFSLWPQVAGPSWRSLYIRLITWGCRPVLWTTQALDLKLSIFVCLRITIYKTLQRTPSLMKCIQGYSSALRQSFVDTDLCIQPLVPSCYTHPASFPPAQAESGNISIIGTQNLGLRPGWYPCRALQIWVLWHSSHKHLCFIPDYFGPVDCFGPSLRPPCSVPREKG